jgi:hypothetical protein
MQKQNQMLQSTANVLEQGQIAVFLDRPDSELIKFPGFYQNHNFVIVIYTTLSTLPVTTNSLSPGWGGGGWW